MTHTHGAVLALPALGADAAERRSDPAMVARLSGRRSPPLRSLGEPGPTAAELETLLTLGLRVPDHGRLEPWRILVFEGTARGEAGSRLDAVYGAQNPGLPAAKARMWHDYFCRAPLVLVVVSRPDPTSRIPAFHQELSAGALAMNLEIAALALGFACQWLLKWPGRDPEALRLLGIGAGERVAGFLHVGRPTAVVPDRPRPELSTVVSRWRP